VSFYGLDHQPIGSDEGGRLLGDADARRVARTEVGDAVVSTVFLVIDHNWGDGPPLLYETMVFRDGDWVGEDQWRYSTRAAALAGHEEAVATLRATP
jgi:hypothetical protein